MRTLCILIFLELISAGFFLQMKGQMYAQDSQMILRRSAEEVIQHMNEEDLDEFTTEELLHSLNQLIDQALDINADELNPLLEFRLLNEYQFLQLQAYLKKRGRIHSVFEVEWIEGFDRETFLQIYPFIYAGEKEIKPEFKSRKIKSIYGTSDLLYKESLLAKDPENNARGSRPLVRFSTRLKAGKSWQAFIKAEKDAWEAFSDQGFDHYSGYLHWKSASQTTEFILGNYQIQSGQGAGKFSGAYRFRSIDNPENIRLFQSGIKPYGGSDENNPLQGFAFSSRLKNIKLNVYASYRNRDAILNDKNEVTSLLSSGLHNDSLSLIRRKNLQETSSGLNLILFLKQIHIGFHSQWKMYDHPLVQENWDGSTSKHKNIMNHSLDYQYAKANFNLFGEWFIDESIQVHQIHGITYFLNSKIQISTQIKATGLQILNQQTENSTNKLNNISISSYLGIKLTISSKIRLTAMLNKENQQNAGYRADHPTEKISFQSRVSWNPNKNTQLFMQYQSGLTSEKDLESVWLSRYNQKLRKHHFRIQLAQQLSEQLIWQSRANLKIGSSEKSGISGSMLFQGIKWIINEQFTIKARYTWYSTVDFASSFSVYEDDLPGLFSNAILYERGQRFYVMLKGTIGENLLFYVKISESVFFNRQQIGEGIGSIGGNRKPELSFLIRYNIN